MLDLYYINALFPDLRDITDMYVVNTTFNDFIQYDLGKMCQQFKNLRKFHINVSLHMSESRFENHYDPEDVDTIFQDITDVKIQFYRYPIDWDTGEMVFTIIKKPNQKSEISTY